MSGPDAGCHSYPISTAPASGVSQSDRRQGAALTGARAIGIIRRDQTTSVDADYAAIEIAAHRHGFELHTILVSDAELDPLDTVQAIRGHDITVIITPTSAHVWDLRRALTELGQVVILDPVTYWSRYYQWPRSTSPNSMAVGP